MSVFILAPQRLSVNHPKQWVHAKTLRRKGRDEGRGCVCVHLGVFAP